MYMRRHRAENGRDGVIVLCIDVHGDNKNTGSKVLCIDMDRPSWIASGEAKAISSDTSLLLVSMTSFAATP